MMSDLMRRVKAILTRTEKQRGRKLYFHVRVVPRIETSYERGLDVTTWVNEGLVDAITLGCGYMTVSLDLMPWLKLVQNKPCFIYTSINHWRTTEETRAWAHLMYDRGAHGVQLFNYGHLLFGHDRNSQPTSERQGTVWYSELHPDYYRVLHELHDPKVFQYRNKRYVLESIPHERLEGEAGKTHREFRAVDAIALPLTLSPGRHGVDFGVADDLKAAVSEGVTPRITLRLKLTNFTPHDDIDAVFNRQLLPRSSRSERAVFIMNDFSWINYPIPIQALQHGMNRVELIVNKLNPQMSVQPLLSGVELLIEFDKEPASAA